MRVCRELSQDSLKDGLRAVAWNTLTQVPSVENDGRVLEALKMLSVIDEAFSFLIDAVLFAFVFRASSRRRLKSHSFALSG